MCKSYSFFFLAVIFLVSCGGGGGGGGSDSGGSGGNTGGGGSINFPSVSITSDKEDAEVTTQVTLSWSSTNATSCSASGAWSGTKGTSGSEAVTVSQAGANTFSLSCSNSAGSSSSSVSVLGFRKFNGVAFDGYLSGAEIFIDENSNAQQDSNEYSATTDGNGAFNLRYTDGVLISKNGTDVDTQTALSNYVLKHKLSGYTESKVISPITTLAAYFADSSKLNAALGLDSTLDITITDPIPNKGDKGPYDYLYEKGTQATVLALALTNIANNGFNQSQTTTTQTTFELIAKELEAQYTESNARVDIEREDFLAKVVERLSATLSTTFSDANKATVSQALSNVLPVVEVKDNAAVTVAAMRFGLNLFQQDIAKLAAGTASSEVVTAYQSNILGYIAADQGVSADDLAPNITAIDDNVTIDEDTEGQFNVLNNDSYLTAYEIGLSITSDPSHGSLSVTGGTVTYQPDPNYNGSDSFTYQITQGTKVSNARVTITINPINDAPELNFSSSFSVNENSTLVGVMSANDVDGDQLEVSLSGTNADLFTIDSITFELNFKEAPDYESGNVSFAVTIVVKDAEFTVSRDIAITVNNLNDNAPTIDGPTSITIEENSDTFIGNYEFSDADGDAVQIRISGEDAEFVTYANKGNYAEVYLIDAADYESKTNYQFRVVAFDGLYENSVDVSIEVTNIIEQLQSFSYMDQPVATNSNGSFIIGDDGDEPVFFMNFPQRDKSDFDGWFGRDYRSSKTYVAASGTGTEFVTAEANGSCSSGSGGQGSIVVYQYYNYSSFPVTKCYQGNNIAGNFIDIDYEGKRFVTRTWQDQHGIAVYDYVDNENIWQRISNTFIPDSNGPEGNGIVISGNGERMAWGSVDRVKVFEINGDSVSWKEIFSQNISGYSIDLNESGTRLVFSNKDSGEVQIWDISQEGNASLNSILDQSNWSQEPLNLGQSDSNDFFGVEVSFDSTGNKLAIGFPQADNNVRDTGKVALYSYSNETWNLYHVYENNSNNQGAKRGYVALTHDGTKVAAGSWNENSKFYEAFANPNQNPIFDLPATNSKFNLTENTTRVTELNAIDPDGDNLTFSFNGRDGRFFELNNGYLAFKTAPNYEDPKDEGLNNLYQVTVKASDGKNWDYRFFEVTVNNDSQETAPANQLWGGSRDYGFGSMDLELSQDGNRLAVLSDDSSSYYKELRLYEWNGSAWNLLKSFSCYECIRTSISGDGNYIAVGKRSSSWNVRVYDFNADSWHDVPSATDASTATADIDLNYDGSKIIVGFPEENSGSGKASVYQRNDNSWSLLTDDIVYANLKTTGWRVQISDDGSRVAVANINTGMNSNSEKPEIHIYKENNNTYKRVNTIKSDYLIGSFGEEIDLTPDGNNIIIGSPNPRSYGDNEDIGNLRNGAAYVYSCTNEDVTITLECSQVGNTLIGDYEDLYFGYNVAINSNATKILVQALKYPIVGDTQFYNGKVSTYNLSNNQWIEDFTYTGISKNNRAGENLDLSADGSMIIFSEPFASPAFSKEGIIHYQKN